MSWVKVEDYQKNGWRLGVDAGQRSRYYCEQLERGEILYFPNCPFSFSQEDQAQLLSQRQSGFRFHKNVSFQPKTGQIRGLSTKEDSDQQELQRIMANFSSKTVHFFEQFLMPYARNYRLDFASYRPVEENGRQLSLHKRNDLLHVDAFPNRPTQGGRILRIFMNINPHMPRIWHVGEDFEQLAKQHVPLAQLSTYAWQCRWGWRSLVQTVSDSLRKAVGKLKNFPSVYDRCMQRFHNYLKENEHYQKSGRREEIEFPPGSSWIVYTDAVPHAVMSGQFALEQTFIVPLKSMVDPQQAPIHILETICKQKLAA